MSLLPRLSAFVLAAIVLAAIFGEASAMQPSPGLDRGMVTSPGQKAAPQRIPRAATSTAHVPRKRVKPVTAAAAVSQVHVAATPDRWYLDDLPFEPQRMNNCGPVTTNMLLGHFGIHLSQEYTAAKLRPDPGDVSVDDREMVTFAQVEYGYDGEVRWGGNMRLLEALIANDIPVIVLQLLAPDSDIDHFRVVHGYDRVRRTVTVSDSYRGRNMEWSYEYFEGLWNRRGYEYAVIHPRAKTPLVQAITLRFRTDDETSKRLSLKHIRNYIASSPADPWGWLQLGQTFYYWGRYEEARQAWDRARELELPQKALWYDVWPIRLINQSGQHREARDLASEVIAKNPSSAEAYYERARANHALGNMLLARDDLSRALDLAPYSPSIRKAHMAFSEDRWVE